jgi:hypothetical protein
MAIKKVTKKKATKEDVFDTKSPEQKHASVRGKTKNGRPLSFKGMLDRSDEYMSFIFYPEYQRVTQLDFNKFKEAGFNMLNIKFGVGNCWIMLDPHTNLPNPQLNFKTAKSELDLPELNGLKDVYGNPINFTKVTYFHTKFYCENTNAFDITLKKDLTKLQKFLNKCNLNPWVEKLMIEDEQLKIKCILERVKNKFTKEIALMITGVENKEEGIFVPINEINNDLWVYLGFSDDGNYRSVIANHCERQGFEIPPSFGNGCFYTDGDKIREIKQRLAIIKGKGK